jgi:multidrug efflux pump subunit AcrA (membrane-fusion protein)
LYYALATPAETLRPGERVLVELPLTTAEQGLVVPDSAVLYDIHGATWVYEDLGGHAYTRRRIEVARHAGDRAVVSRGLAEGIKVVTAGAAELFGTEFGAGH